MEGGVISDVWHCTTTPKPDHIIGSTEGYKTKQLGKGRGRSDTWDNVDFKRVCRIVPHCAPVFLPSRLGSNLLHFIIRSPWGKGSHFSFIVSGGRTSWGMESRNKEGGKGRPVNLRETWRSYSCVCRNQRRGRRRERRGSRSTRRRPWGSCNRWREVGKRAPQ